MTTVPKRLGYAVCDAYLTVNTMLDGVLFLYYGIEYCDGNRHSLFFNRFHTNGLDCTINRSKHSDGAARRRHLRALINLRKTEPALDGGKLEFFNTKDNIFSFTRSCAGQTLMVCVNMRNEKSETALPYKIKTVKYGERFSIENGLTLLPFGFIIAETEI